MRLRNPLRRKTARDKAREFVKALQAERPDELFPGANGTGKMLVCCGHEQQRRGATRTILSGECKAEAKHAGRCLGCAHCPRSQSIRRDCGDPL